MVGAAACAGQHGAGPKLAQRPGNLCYALGGLFQLRRHPGRGFFRLLEHGRGVGAEADHAS